jgi:hypothetical protein
MKSAQISYVVMLAVFAAGLWLILRVGSRLEAPKDIAGQWTLTWSNPQSDLPKQIAFRQSGRFITAELQANGKRIPLHGELDRYLSVRLESREIALTASFDRECRGFRGHLEGAVAANVQGSRVPSASADFR